MKRHLLIPLLALTTISASAIAPFEKGKTAPRQHRHAAMKKAPARAVELQVLIDEDFSRFSDGTDMAPGNEISYENGYYIPAEYTTLPGWTGRGVHPAGGSVALYKFEDNWGDERDGYISTPRLMLDGTATLTFRAKALDGEAASMWVVLCDDYYGPGYDEITIEPGNEWEEYTLVATEGSLEEPSYFQFMAEEGIVLIDDVRIEFRNDRIATPYALPAINTSPTEFIANWEEVSGAETYRLNVLCNRKAENPVSGEVSTDFSSLNLNGTSIDSENPGYPEGWTIEVSQGGSQDAGTAPGDYNSAPASVKFDAVGDMIESPELPYPLDDITFWVKPTKMADNDYDMSLLRVELYHSTNQTWEAISHIPYYWMEAGGGMYSFAREALGNDVTRVRFLMIQRGMVDFYIDDIRLHYTELGTTEKVIDNLDVEGTQYTVSDINPDDEYSYYVQAVKGDIVSGISYVIWVDGITGLKVVTNEASDITHESFTASWQPLGHATDYKVESFRVIESETDLYDVTVLEENFDRIGEGTTDNPGTDWISPFDFGARGWADTAWGATQPAWAAGMAGTTGTNVWMGTAGLVFTPTLDLSCHDGNGIKVEATVFTTVDEFEYYGNPEPEGMFVMILRNPYDQQPIASGYMDTPNLGSNSGTMLIGNIPADADLSQVIIAFMNKSGLTFFVDSAKISMNVPAGSSLMTPAGVINTQETSCTFDNLDPMADHGFAVTASATRNYEKYESLPSDIRIVKTTMVGVDSVGEDEISVAAYGRHIVVNAPADAAVNVYDTCGIRVASASGQCSLPVAAGLYIVEAAGRSFKVMVK